MDDEIKKRLLESNAALEHVKAGKQAYEQLSIKYRACTKLQLPIYFQPRVSNPRDPHSNSGTTKRIPKCLDLNEVHCG